MKILLTGGHGYVARNLVPLFEMKGYDVFSPSHKELDLLNRDILERYIRENQFDAVIHTATKGGRRTGKDKFEDVYVPNILMFENLAGCLLWNKTPLIVFGSGAEFNRRERIQEIYESNIHTYWPIDPYGLSKNVITRRSLYSFTNIWILRLFGCFNHDEDDNRFIKHSILNIKNGLPIEIHQNLKMDYFYLNDVFTVIDYILNDENIPKHINLVYKEKYDLMTIAKMIQKYCKSKNEFIKLIDMNEGKDYTGNGNILSKLPIYEKLIGLEEGIKRTCKKLL
jgi:nucleoside-diphosphate-sugar epimerase